MTVSLPFYRNIREAFKAARQADLSAQVRQIASTSTLSDVKPAERKRLAKVEGMLAAGLNPYSADVMKAEGKNLGGSVKREVEIDYAALARDNQTVIDALLAKWGNRVETVTPQRHVAEGSIIPKDVVDDFPTIKDNRGIMVPDPDKVRCSFCSKIVDRNKATTGKAPDEMVRTDVLGLGPLRFRNKWIKFSGKVAACNDCCLNLAPRTFVSDRGERIDSGYKTDFPNVK